MRPSRTAMVVAVSMAIGVLFLLPTSAIGAGAGGHAGSATRHAPGASGLFNRLGNLLITDQFNNRVIEVSPLTKQIVWSFGSGNSTLCNPGPHTIIGSNDAERLAGGLTAMAGTGIPAGVSGTTPCVDNRVIVVDHAGKIVWQYGQAGKTGSGRNLLNVPVFVLQTPNHGFLIVDQGNNRVIEVTLEKKIVWSYPSKTGVGSLNNPNSVELLPNGHVLIGDENNNRVIEVTRGHQIVWSYSQGISAAAFASRLPNGNTIIVDSIHNRVVVVSHAKVPLFQYFTNKSASSNASPLPTNAVQIAGGDMIISDQFNHRVIVINPAKQIVFQYGATNVPGSGFNKLFGPYTAYEIGDYTGQTHPPATFWPSD
ncbi:MAG: hypothetical protein L3K15_06345 [Thermoplasmata archaeon]|nr:hypothetical protein [Thermoplasmata archaeon]